MPEAAALFGRVTGQEFLELVGRLQEVPEERLQARIDLFLEQFGLAEDRGASLDTYSKGMRQRVLLSAALLHNPDVVLLDEPLSGLEVNAGILVRDLIAAGPRHAARLRVPHPVEPPPRAVEIDVPLRLRGRRVSDYVPSRALHVQV